jgi:protein-S-isoprenylcysteine O-methyltransferase Ste14
VTYALLAAAVLFLSSGDLAWAGAWFYLAVVAAAELATAWTLALADPGLLRERSAALTCEATEALDRWLAPLIAFAPLTILLLAGLDERLHWGSDFAPGATVAGVGLAAAGVLLGIWAMTSKPFFTPVVRVRPAQRHPVASSGPYRLVRHPEALGAILVDLAIPLILGSPWAYAPAVVVGSIAVLRAALEDGALRAELPGYAGYARGVRWRLVPGVW